MRRKTISWRFWTAGILVLLLSLAATALGGERKPEQRVFNLSEISVFEVDGPAQARFTRGQLATCSEQREGEVKVYPAFTSDKPLYGSSRFARDYAKGDPGIEYHFAIDESLGTGTGYDRLYLDANRDLDLTNDSPASILENPPDGAILNYTSARQQVCFDYVNVNFAFGPERQRPLEMMPRLVIFDAGSPILAFVTTKAHQGQIEIAGRQYDVLLGHNDFIGGWFDHPSTGLHLVSKKAVDRLPRWLGADYLRAMHKINGTYYHFCATPAGDKLLVKPYDGDFGIFKIGSGWRIIFDKGVYGSLLSTSSYLGIGGETRQGRPEPMASCKLPVGEYLPVHLTIEYKPLRFSISENYYSDGKPSAISDKALKRSVRIRKDRPFVLDFSNNPRVVFASPVKDYRVKLGETLAVEAVLVDPELDIMIRGLERRPWPNVRSASSTMTIMALLAPGLFWACFRRVRKRYRSLPIISALGLIVFVGYTIAMYSVKYRVDYDKLEPHVRITRANGEQVAEGVMPFG